MNAHSSSSSAVKKGRLAGSMLDEGELAGVSCEGKEGGDGFRGGYKER